MAQARLSTKVRTLQSSGATRVLWVGKEALEGPVLPLVRSGKAGLESIGSKLF